MMPARRCVWGAGTFYEGAPGAGAGAGLVALVRRAGARCCPPPPPPPEAGGGGKKAEKKLFPGGGPPPPPCRVCFRPNSLTVWQKYLLIAIRA